MAMAFQSSKLLSKYPCKSVVRGSGFRPGLWVYVHVYGLRPDGSKAFSFYD